MTPAAAIPWERLIVAAALLLAGIALGGWLAARHFEPQLAEANRQIGELEHAYLTLADATGRQNAAIETLRVEGAQRKEKAQQAARQARGAAQPHYDRAKAIMGLKPPPAADPCRAASADFDAELTNERRQR